MLEDFDDHLLQAAGAPHLLDGAGRDHRTPRHHGDGVAELLNERHDGLDSTTDSARCHEPRELPEYAPELNPAGQPLR